MKNQNDQLAIQTISLTKTYKQVAALTALNLRVPKNSIYGFLGPNGAGKTTTIKLLLGLIRPTAGTGSVFGNDIEEDSLNIRSRVGYLPQDPSFYPYMTARETLDFTARFFFRGPDNEIKARVNETLDLVGLADKADRPIKTFSGGERQRLGIGQAQVNYPDLLILDEPAASLDPLGRRDVLAVMEKLKKYATVFYSTHILDDVQRVSDHVAILNKGQLVAEGEVETLLAGSSGTTFITHFRGPIEQTQHRVSKLDWVTSVQTQNGQKEHRMHVSVSDEKLAEDLLLRKILEDKKIVVTDFRRKTYELEEIFVDIVEGGSHDG